MGPGSTGHLPQSSDSPGDESPEPGTASDLSEPSQCTYSGSLLGPVCVASLERIPGTRSAWASLGGARVPQLHLTPPGPEEVRLQR